MIAGWLLIVALLGLCVKWQPQLLGVVPIHGVARGLRWFRKPSDDGYFNVQLHNDIPTWGMTQWCVCFSCNLSLGVQYLKMFFGSFKGRLWLYRYTICLATVYYYSTTIVISQRCGMILLGSTHGVLNYRTARTAAAAPWGEAALYGLPSMLNHSAAAQPWASPFVGKHGTYLIHWYSTVLHQYIEYIPCLPKISTVY